MKFYQSKVSVFSIFSSSDYTTEKLTDILSQKFGQPLCHRNRGKRSYTEVKAEKNAQSYVASHWAQPMHTDEGHTIDFPNIVALYCQQASKVGGVSILVQFQKLYQELKHKFGSNLAQLFNPDCLKVKNIYGDEMKPVMVSDINDKVGISYSPILGGLVCTDLVFEMYNYITQYVHNPQNQIRYKLSPGQMLILNNCQVLHARTGFPDTESRVLYRFWF